MWIPSRVISNLMNRWLKQTRPRIIISLKVAGKRVKNHLIELLDEWSANLVVIYRRTSSEIPVLIPLHLFLILRVNSLIFESNTIVEPQETFCEVRSPLVYPLDVCHLLGWPEVKYQASTMRRSTSPPGPFPHGLKIHRFRCSRTSPSALIDHSHTTRNLPSTLGTWNLRTRKTTEQASAV